MGETFTEAQGLLFAEMDTRAREVVEKKFRVRMDSAQSSESMQAAWEVYQNTTVKLIKAIGSGVEFGDAKGYAATVARNSCRDYWRVYNPGWADLKGRLSRFFRKQPQWSLWETPEQLGWICGPESWKDKPVAQGNRIHALLEKPKSIRASSLPKREVVSELDSTAWNTLLNGIFEYLHGPLRLDDLVSICGVLFGVKGSREMAFEEMMTDDEGRAWDPPAPAPRPDVALAIREQLAKLWSEVKTMPRRWVLPFLLNPPVMKGGTARKPRNTPGEDPEKADRGEVAVFTANGITTVAEMEALIGFTPQQYMVLWRELDVQRKGGPALDAVMDPKLRFAVIWNFLPLEDGIIAKIMELEGAQKVINLRMVARTHLAKTLIDSGIPEKRGRGLLIWLPTSRPQTVKEGSTMPGHLNEEQLKGYRDRTLALGELVAVDAHLGGCQPCRTALASFADGSSSKAVISGVDQARFRHLSYEQMDDWVEDKLDQPGRELVMAHIGACPPCARQLIAYQEYAPVMAAPIQTGMYAATRPVKVKRSFWWFLRQPQYALGAAALITFFIITPLTRHSPPTTTGAILSPTSTALDSTIPAESGALIEAALSTTELDALPDSLRVGAKEAISDAGTRPAALKGLEAGADAILEYPFAEVVSETQPVLRWKAFGDSYSVSISDARGMISRRGGLTETHWTPPGALARDHVYTWEVEAGGQKHRGTFRVLGESQKKELEQVRGSHLVMGAVYEELGLLTPAREEFEAMAKDRTMAQQAAKLLGHLDSLRK